MKSSLVFLFALLLVGGWGCKKAVTTEQPKNQKNDETLNLTLEPQDATFFVLPGWTGGAGDVAVVDPQTRTIKNWEGTPLYGDGILSEEIVQKLKALNCETLPLLKVSARVQMEEKTYENDSIPGGSTQSYIEVKTLQLYSLDTQSGECSPQ